MIREARTIDLPGFIELVHRFRAELSTYPGCPVDRKSLVHVFGRCCNSAQALALVAEHDGEITGALLAILQPLWWSEAKEATDAMIYAEHPGDGYRMAKRYVRWAWRQPKVQIVTMAHSAGGDLEQAARLHRVLGLEPIGYISQAVRPVALEEAA